ncbi:MAG: protein-L-isoaspartate(D-aspartate) O-methyltransferase [Chitinophagales bacterium]|nr:protein-L-isoaspartate(D-aspartate) O-methyltransferase [Chitinophagales bacterium]
MQSHLKFYRKRADLVELLRNKGINNDAVLQVIGKLERHLFIPDTALHSHAYEDKAFPIGAGQTISQPYTVAFQTQLLSIKPYDKVLEIGTGSGYQAAVLAELGTDLYTIERQKELYDKTRPFLLSLGFNQIKFYYGDGYLGKPAFAPFDKILITAAAPYIPPKLLEQLKVGGCMVIPVDDKQGAQDMMRITKLSDKEFQKEVFEKFAFVPMLKGE